MACNSRGETLIKAYQIDISRKDIDTLKGLNWLNDEIINFYMQMIVERSKGGAYSMEFLLHFTLKWDTF